MEEVDLEALLSTHRARLDEADEHRRLSTDRSDYDDVLTAVQEMIDGCTRATLRRLGEPVRPEEPTAGLPRRAAGLLPRRPHAFRNETDLPVLADLVARQEGNLRDIDYLRQGFGLGSGRTKPQDMRWEHPSAVVSDVVSTFGWLFESFKRSAAVERLAGTEVQIDLLTIRAAIEGLLQRDLGPEDFMGSVIDICEAETSVAGWHAFRGLEYEQELSQLRSFFVEVTTKEPPITPLAGFYVEIGYPSRHGETVADMLLAGLGTYPLTDGDVSDEVAYEPLDAWAASNVLSSIYRQAYAPGGMGNAADFALCLAWAAYFARACTRAYLGSTGRERAATVVGFTGGDWIDLGWVRGD